MGSIGSIAVGPTKPIAQSGNESTRVTSSTITIVLWSLSGSFYSGTIIPRVCIMNPHHQQTEDIPQTDRSRSFDRYSASNPGDDEPNKRARTTASPLQEGTASPSTLSIPNLTPAGRISHACRPCNRSKVKCDGFHPCSRCFAMVKAGVTGMSEVGQGSEARTTEQEDGDADAVKEKVQRAALELCFYQPSMRGRTKRRKIKADQRTSTEEVENGASSSNRCRSQTSGGARPATVDDTTHRAFPRVGTSPRPPTPGTAAAPIPSLQAAFFQSSTRHQREEAGRSDSSSWRTNDLTAEHERDHPHRSQHNHREPTTIPNAHTRPPHTDPRLHRHLESHRSDPTGIGDHRERIQLAPMVDRTKLTSFPLPGDETNPLGVLAEASAALEREREVPGQADRGDEKRREEKRVAGGSEGRAASRDADGMTTVDSDAGRERQPSTSQTNEPQTSNPTTHPADADAYYSRPKQGTAGQRTLQGEAPHIMALLTQADAQYLFDIYWQWFHPHLPLLDKDHSDPIDVASRSNYLFNASK